MQDGNIHCSIKNVSRRLKNGEQGTAVAAASYISGARLWNEFEERYTRFVHKNDVVFSELVVPAHAEDWCHNREALWNTVDRSARRKDARLAKSIVIAFTRGIPRDMWPDMLRQYVAPWVKQGMVADIAIHDDKTDHNPHGHVLLTVNQLKPDGFGKKITNVDQRSFVTQARTGWEQITNNALKAIGSSVRVDARSYKVRGLELQPTKHRGPDRVERREGNRISNQIKEEIMMEGQEDDRRRAAEDAAQRQLHDNNVGSWFERKMDANERSNELQPVQQAGRIQPKLWYESAVENARLQAEPAQDPNAGMTDWERDSAQQHAENERDVWQRAVNLKRTRQETELLEAVRHASPEAREFVEKEIMRARISNVRNRDERERQQQIEKDIRAHDPTVWNKIKHHARELFEMPEVTYEVQPEPGPYNEPTNPYELDKAKDRLIEENEREQDR